MEITLGMKPHEIVVLLPRNGDFVTTIEAIEGETWPAGSSIEIHIENEVWAVNTSANQATFDIPNETVNEVIDSNPKTSRLYYKDTDGSMLLWGVGDVRII